MVLCVGNFPIPNQFGLELELAVFHRVCGGVNQVHDAHTNTCAEGFHRGRDQVNGFVRVANMGQIHHGWERFSVVNVGHSATVFISCWAAVRLAVAIQVKEIHPQTHFRCTPAAHERITKSCSTSGRVNRVRLG